MKIAQVAAILIALTASPCFSAEPPRAADPLLELVPAHSAAVLTVEGLRSQWNSPAVKRLVVDIRALPFVKSWLDSQTFQHWEQSREQIETVLGVTVDQFRDEILGDAFVLALRFAQAGPRGADRQPQGILLIKPRDPHVLTQLIEAVNRAQLDSGELVRVDDRHRGDVAYHVREFPGGSGRPSEFYTDAMDGIFAISNSEPFFHTVIDTRKGTSAQRTDGGGEDHAEKGPSALASVITLARFQSVAHRLPAKSLARFYVDPRAIEMLLTSGPQPADSQQPRLPPLLESQLAAANYAGAAISIEDARAGLDLIETFDPDKLDQAIRQWSARPSSSLCNRVVIPPSAIGLVSVSIDLAAIHNLITRVMPENERIKLESLKTLLTSMLLGQDVVTRIMPALGPGVLAYIDAPSGEPRPTFAASSDWLFPLVMIVELSGSGETSGMQPSVGRALENGLRALCAVMALDDKRAGGRSRIHDQTIAGVRVTTLDPAIPFAFAVDHQGKQLVVGSSAAGVARYLEFRSKPDQPAGVTRFRPAAFAAFETFLSIDLDAGRRALESHRDRVIAHLSARKPRPAGDVARDLDHLLEVSRLFQSAGIAMRLEPKATAAHQTISVLFAESHATKP